ncbi:hypothetical protein Tco_0575221 [Tanacetum coccineum]
MFSSQNHQVYNCVVKPIKIIPGPAGIVQTINLCKIADTRESGEKSVMSTQEYIRKVIEDVGEDDNFTRASWLSMVEYVNVDGGIVTGYFGDVNKFLKNWKLEKVFAIIKSCTPNALGRSHGNTQRPFWYNLWYYSLQSAYRGDVFKGDYRRSGFDT